MAFQKSDHCDGKTFFNPWGANNKKSFWDVLKWKWTSKALSWEEVPKASPPALPPAPSAGVGVTWVNHSTFLIRGGGLNLLTDPLWAERTSPLSFIGPKRAVPPGIAWEELPKIDVVLVSHNHYDHLDVATLKRLSERDSPLILVPLGDKGWLAGRGIKNVEEMDWWQSRELPGARVTFLPAQHWSARWTWDRNESLWGAWGVELAGQKIYHAGDTGLGPHFKQTRERWGAPDVALLPIGAYEPRWFMKDMHMNPADALEALLALEARQALGMHFGTFQLTDEERERPAADLAEALAAKGIPAERFRVPQLGQSFSFQ